MMKVFAVKCAKRHAAILAVIVSLVFTACISVRSIPGNRYGDLQFDEASGTITDYYGSGGALEIPPSINGTAVTVIGQEAFAGLMRNYQFPGVGLISVTIPNGVTTIEANAFSGNSLTAVYLPESVTSVAPDAFDREVEIIDSSTDPERVVMMAMAGFIPAQAIPASSAEQSSSTQQPNSSAPAPAATEATTPTAASRPNTIDDFEITQNEKGTITITGYKREAPRDVVIPDNIEGIAVTDIAGSAFVPRRTGPLDERKAPLTSVVIPASVTTIGGGAFGSNNLTSVVIPDSVTSIGGSAFSSNQLTSVVISKNLKTIPSNAFAGNKLREVTIPESVTLIEDSAFRGNQLESVVIPNGVTSIGSDAFINNKLSEVMLGNSIKTIGAGAFAGNQISSLVIPASVTRFEGNTTTGQAGAFQSNALTSIVIPAGVTYVGEETFADNQIASVTITSNATTFGGYISEGNFANGPFINNPITSITLPANADFREVSYGRQSDTIFDVFPNNFNTYYQSQGRKAGTYTWSGRLWSVR